MPSKAQKEVGNYLFFAVRQSQCLA